ncbi:RhoGAP domain containing protein [Babesia bovis T2Bo]|uniref:RhoGAP domain containing protein n=1 Tax=Babesia bovis TaxID=5865 RepID=A7AW84_BABBO|nr:RhoGAP domain containing protein [Babesia bovis T2Bo]EDO05312.1 RhoGAP domain containing protein [Babesia bovis T2Bo]|eukprot:XP_001608880.1 RhoGAP domain containing protein [Babesia bovis T2Bo]
MSFTSAFNFYKVPYDSDVEPIEQYGSTYIQMLAEDFKEDGFDEPNLVTYLGKDPVGNSVVLIVPSISARICENHEDALRLMVKKMDRHCSSKYSLIVCQTCTTWSDYNSYNFVNQWYDMLPKASKKNLVKVYLVHSAYTTKTALTCVSPFAGLRVWEKLEFVDQLGELLKRIKLDTKNMLRNFPYAVQRAEEIALGISTPLSVFGTEMWILAQRVGRPFKGFPLIPPVVSHVLEKLISSDVIDTPNLLNIQCTPDVLYTAVDNLENYGEGCKIESAEAAVALFKLIIDSHVGGLIGPSGYITFKNALLQGNTDDELVKMIAKVISEFSSIQKDCILCVIKTLRAIARRASKNHMTVRAISKILAGSFFRPLSPDTYCSKVMSSGEMVLGTMIEKPDIFFKRSQPAEEQASVRSKHDKRSDNAKSSSGPPLSKSPSMRAREEIQRVKQRREAQKDGSAKPDVPSPRPIHPSMDDEEPEDITEIEE